MPWTVDFLGRFRKIRAPVATSVHAVFEAVANAFDATADLEGQGQITVRILRRPALLSTPSDPEFDLYGYEITDNGIGLTDEHMTNFTKSDTTAKLAGRGVGRLLWLKVFDRAEISSTYRQSDQFWTRSFTFSLAKNGSDDAETAPTPATANDSVGTTVRLLDPKSLCLKALPQTSDGLARQLLEHFLLYFTAIRGQTVTVTDSATGDSVRVGDLYADIIGDRHKAETVEIRGFKFELHHLLVKPMHRLNLIKLCAARRAVTSEAVCDLVPEVSRSDAVEVEGSLRYHAYVTGTYLDDIVDDERTGLKFARDIEPRENSQVTMLPEPELYSEAEDELTKADGVSKRELYAELAQRIRAHLSERIAEVREARERKLEDFAEREQPQFRPFVARAKEHLDRLPARPTKRQIEVALYQAKIDGRDDLERLVEQITASRPSIGQVQSYARELVAKFADEANRHNQSALVEYICSRKAVIEVLRAHLGKNSDDKNELEAAIHDLFFPRFSDSDKLPVGPNDRGMAEIANLWLIDERLVFHRLLSSDQSLSRIRRFLTGEVGDKDDEPDLIIFDPAFVTSDSDDIQSVAIVEFKQPGRTSYSLKDNPIKQIIDLTRKIREKGLKDVRGAVRSVTDSVRFYGYAICDVTDPLEDIIKYTYFMNNMPDGDGYYKYEDKINLIIEVIPYQKVVLNAGRRNAAFFKKLGIP